MKVFDVWLGDGEYERAYGERLVGQVYGNDIDEARANALANRWIWMDSHNVTPGYWICEAISLDKVYPI